MRPGSLKHRNVRPSNATEIARPRIVGPRGYKKYFTVATKKGKKQKSSDNRVCVCVCVLYIYGICVMPGVVEWLKYSGYPSAHCATSLSCARSFCPFYLIYAAEQKAG